MNRIIARGRSSVTGLVRTGLGRALSLVEPRIAVICYHVVADVPSDPWSLFVSVENFNAQLAVLEESTEILSLDDVARGMLANKLPKRGVVMTFDDGYYGATNTAAPVLASRGMPATMFIASSLIDMKSECWWDELEQLFLLPGDLPSRLEIEIGRTRLSESLDPCATYDEKDFERNRQWMVSSRTVPTARHRLFVRVYQLLKPLENNEREKKIRELWDWSSRAQLLRETHKLASSADLKALARLPGIAIGGHTFAHPTLTQLSAGDQSLDIEKGKHVLEMLTSQSITSFAYPYGGHGDFDAQTVRAVRSSGFSAACTTVPASITPRSDVFAIPRWPAYNCNGPAFGAHLKKWLST